MSGHETVDYGTFRTRLSAVQPTWRDLREARPERDIDLGARWDLLRGFQEEWGFSASGAPAAPRRSETEHRAWARLLSRRARGEPGLPPSALPGAPVPRAIEEWWELPWNSFTLNPRLYWTHAAWPPSPIPDPAGDDDRTPLEAGDPVALSAGDRRLCAFMTEYQDCNRWVYPAGWGSWPDPPVLVDVAGERGAGWVAQSRSVTEFFLQLAAMRLPASLGWTVDCSRRPDVAEVARRATGELPELGFLPWREVGQETHLHGAADAIVFHDAAGALGTLWACGRSREALERLGRRLGLDWGAAVRAPAAT